MARSRKSNILIAHAIAWGGAILAALIATYGPHGPARHPKMMLIVVMLLAATSLVSLRGAHSRRKVIGAHGVLWGIAGLTAFVLANTSIVDGVHPIATTVMLLVLGAISLAILWNAKIDDAVAEQATPKE